LKIALRDGESFTAEGRVSLLDEALGAGKVLEYSCRTGQCGTCRAGVVSGETRLLVPEIALTAAQIAAGDILTCCRAAASDMALDAVSLDELAGIQRQTLPCRIDRLERPAPDVIQLLLRLPPGRSLTFLAGQYVDVIAAGGLRRSYSIANAPRPDGRIELHIRKVEGGAMSAYWFGQAKANDLLRMEGPLGTFFFRKPERVSGRDVMFLATGTGLAPLKAMLESLEAFPDFFTRNRVHLLWGGRVAEDIYWSPAFSGPLRFEPVLSRARAGEPSTRRYVQHVALESLPALGAAIVYACGSSVMIDTARDLLLGNGLHPDDYHFEPFVSSGGPAMEPS
jgi:CDP-4-dehydro-6-deoxyglucose reductase, E3